MLVSDSFFGAGHLPLPFAAEGGGACREQDSAPPPAKTGPAEQATGGAPCMPPGMSGAVERSSHRSRLGAQGVCALAGSAVNGMANAAASVPYPDARWSVQWERTDD